MKKRNTIKKNISILLALTLLCMVIAGCGKTSSSNTDAPSAEAPSDSQDAATEAAEDTSAEASETETAEAPVQPVEMIKIRAAYHPNLGPMSIPGIDAKMGYFAEEGLEVEWLKFTSGAPEIAAMASGDLQFGYIGQGALKLCAEGQADVISLSHLTNSEAILVRADSGIASFEDLKGKKVATELGTNGEVLLNMACEKYNVSRDEIEVINMPISNAIAAFIGGSTDAVVAWGPDLTNIKNNVDEEMLAVVETKDFVDSVPFLGSWIGNPDYIEENQDIVQRFQRALNKCYDYRASHLDETIQAAADFAVGKDIGVSYDDLNSERDQLVFFNLEEEKEWVSSGHMEELFQLQLNYMQGQDQIGADVSVTDYVRLDLIQKALETQ